MRADFSLRQILSIPPKSSSMSKFIVLYLSMCQSVPKSFYPISTQPPSLTPQTPSIAPSSVVLPLQTSLNRSSLFSRGHTSVVALVGKKQVPPLPLPFRPLLPSRYRGVTHLPLQLCITCTTLVLFVVSRIRVLRALSDLSPKEIEHIRNRTTSQSDESQKTGCPLMTKSSIHLRRKKHNSRAPERS